MTDDDTRLEAQVERLYSALAHETHAHVVERARLRAELAEAKSNHANDLEHLGRVNRLAAKARAELAELVELRYSELRSIGAALGMVDASSAAVPNGLSVIAKIDEMKAELAEARACPDICYGCDKRVEHLEAQLAAARAEAAAERAATVIFMRVRSEMVVQHIADAIESGAHRTEDLEARLP